MDKDVQNCRLISDGKLIAALTKSAKRLNNTLPLRSLNVKGCWKITDLSLYFVASYCTQLENLDLEALKKVSSVGLEMLAGILKELPFKQVKLKGAGTAIYLESYVLVIVI
jgi:hypothetical protein